jgi:hypothetical protein
LVSPSREPAVRLYVPPGHFYSPIVEPGEAERCIAAVEAARPPESLPGIPLVRSDLVETWHKLLPFLQTIPFQATQARGLRYVFDNPSYAWGDGSILHAMLRLYRPRRVVEIGGGWSSACTVDTAEKYLDGRCELTFIDPYPQLLRGVIGDAATRVRILEQAVQQVPLTLFAELEAGDILFIDSTHVLRTGSDVCTELFDILPRLKSGVVVHFHDMFWPFEYPRAWAVDENRSWNELYAVRAFLTQNSAWRVRFFNDYFFKLEHPLIEKTYPQFLSNPGGALWIERL